MQYLFKHFVTTSVESVLFLLNCVLRTMLRNMEVQAASCSHKYIFLATTAALTLWVIEAIPGDKASAADATNVALLVLKAVEGTT